MLGDPLLIENQFLDNRYNDDEWKPTEGGLFTRPSCKLALLGAGTGDIARDSSPYGNHGALVNAPGLSRGLGRKAWRFSGAGDKGISLGDPIPGDITQLSLSVWCYFAGSATDYGVIYRGAQSASTGALSLWYDNAATDHYAFLVRDSSGHYVVKYSACVPLVNTWTNIGIVFTGGDSTSLYIDGIEDSNSPFATSAVLNIQDHASGWWVGRDSTGAKEMLGDLADIELFSTLLSLPEIRQLASRHPDLDGNIQSTSPMWTPMSGGAAPPSSYPTVLLRQNQIIGGGVA